MKKSVINTKNGKKVLCILLLALLGGRQYAQEFPEQTYKNFSLYDHKKATDLFSVEEVKSNPPEKIFSQTIDESNPFSYSQAKFNDARQAVESGALGDEEVSPRTQQIFDPLMNAQNLPPSLQLTKYGTSLEITGRKLIGFEYTGKKYLKDQSNTGREKEISSFDLTQELQVRIQGKIGPRITVNVDYDDTRVEKQDISIIYQGEKDEVVQNASFGDIDLSLPATEFVSYNKQLFGIRMDLKTGGFNGTFIGSRTKGTTKVKQFVGNTLAQSRTIPDIAYTRRKYYNLQFNNQGRLPIVQGSEQVYVDTQNYTDTTYANTVALTVSDYAVPSSQYSGRFKLLARGIDYTVDYTKGIITFTVPLNQQDVAAINFTNADGSPLSSSPSLIKTYNDLPIASDLEYGYRAEFKTYYSIGQTQIVRDDGKGNFNLIVQDANKNNVGATLAPKQQYPDTITVDFENGIFYLQEPFGAPGDPSSPDPQIYATTPVSKRSFLVEYNSRIRTFTLEPNIVVQSENVILDGRKLIRNGDYYVDYDSGFITFYNDDSITSTSVIDISYDVSPFGGMGDSSLLGVRAGYDFSDHFSIGSTILYEAASKSQTTPSVSDTASSTLVYEADIKLKEVKISSSSTLNLSLELAHSVTNPNLNDYALIDNMEGVKEQTAAPLDAISWRIASNPGLVPAYYTSLNWRTEELKVIDIFPNSQTQAGAVQDVLTVDYDFTNSDEISIVYPYSNSGLDFTKKNMLEMQLYGDGSPSDEGPQMQVHLGQIDEDSDATGGQTRVCANGVVLTNAPKSEDMNCNGILESSEDIGWLYSPSAQPTTRYGAKNGRIDTQDLDGNGRLDPANNTGGSFGYSGTMNTVFQNVTDSVTTDKFNFSGWKTLQSPMVIPNGQEYLWSGIKHLRFSLKKTPGGRNKGTIRIARLSVVGNTWAVVEQGVNSSTLNLSGINNEDNPNYVPIFKAGGEAAEVYNYLYGSPADQARRTGTTNVVEQSLNLMYSSNGPAKLGAQKNFTTPINLAQHKEFRFLLSNPSGNEVTGDVKAFLRIGDDNNYQQISVPIDFTGWRLYVIKQVDLNGDNVPDYWENACPYNVEISSAGTTNFQAVSILTSGVQITNGIHSGAIWLDEIHLASPNNLSGTAISAKGDYRIDGWGEIGGQYRSVDKDFQTPVSVATNQDQELMQGYLKLTKLKNAPISTSYTRTKTETPKNIDNSNSNIVTSLDQGVVIKESGNAETTLLFDRLPSLRLAYDFTKNDYQLLTRNDDNKSYTAALNYAVDKQPFYVPKKIDASFVRSNNKTTYSQSVINSNTIYYNAAETVNNLSVKLDFVPLKDSAIKPTYSLRTVTENREDLNASFDYNKSMTQNAGLSGNIKIFDWLNPSYNYQVSTIENNNLTVSTVTVGNTSKVYNIGQIKTVNRSAIGTANLAIDAVKLFPKVKWINTLGVNASYQLSDGDTWENVDASYNTKGKLWLRSAFDGAGQYAKRSNFTSRDTYKATTRWRPLQNYALSKRLAALQTLSISNTFSQSREFKDVTGTTSTTLTRSLPDLLLAMNKLESFFGSQKWISGSTLNFKYNVQNTKTAGISDATTTTISGDIRALLFQWMDTAVTALMQKGETYDEKSNRLSENFDKNNFSAQITLIAGDFRITPKIEYAQSNAVKGVVKTEQTTTITPSLSLRGDFTLAKGLKLPFVKNPLSLSNRIIWITTLSYKAERSPVDELYNSNLLEFTTSLDYELSKNVRITANAGAQRLWHLYLEQEEYLGYNAGTSLVLQF